MSDFYPSEFSSEARDEKERIRACRELLPSEVYHSKDQGLAISCIMRIFLAFVKETRAPRKELGWSIDRVKREAEEFLRRLTIDVVFEKFPGLDPLLDKQRLDCARCGAQIQGNAGVGAIRRTALRVSY